MEQEKILFLVHIADAYSFRNTINIIHKETHHCTMFLTPTAIEFSFINKSKCAMHKILFNVLELPAYSYNFMDENGNLLPQYPLTFETTDLYNTTRNIKKTDSLRIYWLAGDNRLTVQPFKNSTKDPGKTGALFVNIVNQEFTKYDTNHIYASEPNVRVPAKDFAEICAQAISLKCAYLEILGQSNSVIFKGILANNNVASFNKFSTQKDISPISYQVNDIDDILQNLKLEDPVNPISNLSLNIIKKDDLMTVRVPLSTYRALSKIHNSSPNGTLLRFYFSEGKPTKIESPIGTFGLHSIFIRNSK